MRAQRRQLHMVGRMKTGTGDNILLHTRNKRKVFSNRWHQLVINFNWGISRLPIENGICASFWEKGQQGAQRAKEEFYWPRTRFRGVPQCMLCLWGWHRQTRITWLGRHHWGRLVAFKFWGTCIPDRMTNNWRGCDDDCILTRVEEKDGHTRHYTKYC